MSQTPEDRIRAQYKAAHERGEPVGTVVLRIARQWGCSCQEVRRIVGRRPQRGPRFTAPKNLRLPDVWYLVMGDKS